MTSSKMPDYEKVLTQLSQLSPRLAALKKVSQIARLAPSTGQTKYSEKLNPLTKPTGTK